MLSYGPKFVGFHFGAQKHCEEIELKCHNFAGDNALLLDRCRGHYLANTPHHCLDLKFGFERARLVACEPLSIIGESTVMGRDGAFFGEHEEIEEAREIWPAGQRELAGSQKSVAEHEDKRQQLEVTVEQPAVKVEERTRMEQFRLSLSRLTLTRRRETKSRAYSVPKEAMISYCHGEASEQARQLKAALERLGVSTYLDLDEIRSGEDWQDSLNEAVLNCRCLVALVTPSYGETLWTSRELKLADLVGKMIIPVNFGQRWPPPSLAIQFASRQYVEWSVKGPDLSDEVGPTLHKKRRLLRWLRRKSWQKRRSLSMELSVESGSEASSVAQQIKTSLDKLDLRELFRVGQHAHSGDDSPSDSALGTSEESAESVTVDGGGGRRWLQHLLGVAGHRLVHPWRSHRACESEQAVKVGAEGRGEDEESVAEAEVEVEVEVEP